MLFLNYAFIPQILSVYGDTDLNKMELQNLECRRGKYDLFCGGNVKGGEGEGVEQNLIRQNFITGDCWSASAGIDVKKRD